MRILIEASPDFKARFGKEWYDNFLNLTACKDILTDYVEAQLALLRNNYVYFPRRRFYNRVTKNFAMDFDPSYMDIKDRYKSGDYRIQKYTTIFEDEKTLTANNVDDRDEKKADKGKEKFLRLIRQMGKGTVHYICTAQDFGRDVALYRELATSVLYVMDREEKEVISFLRPFYKFLLETCDDLLTYYEGILNQVQDWQRTHLNNIVSEKEARKVELTASEKEKVQKAFDDATKRKSKIRKFRHRVNQLINKEFACSFIRYRGVIYYDANDVGKDIDKDDGSPFSGSKGEYFDFYFPITFAYGSSDTYAYSALQDMLVDKSMAKQDFYDPNERIIPSADSDNGRDYFEAILRKKSDANGQGDGA